MNKLSVNQVFKEINDLYYVRARLASIYNVELLEETLKLLKKSAKRYPIKLEEVQDYEAFKVYGAEKIIDPKFLKNLDRAEMNLDQKTIDLLNSLSKEAIDYVESKIANLQKN